MRTPEKLIFHDMVEYLESMIVSGKYPPGSPIPTLRELCRMFHLSTGTAARRTCRGRSRTPPKPGSRSS